jgi:ATP-dependent exoDNAse (exonuclease V) alpha subunit
MRQEEGSEIIQLTMKIRNGEEIKYFNGETVKVIPKTELNTGLLTWGDQVLVATNAVRHNINNQMRALFNREGEPQDGDKVICIRNYWEDINEKGDALVNGTLGYIHNPYTSYNKIPAFAGNNTIEVLNAEFIDDEGISYKNLQMDKKLLTVGDYSLDWRQKYKLGKNPRTKHLVPKEFVYGYAITYWKAQGSEWDNVVVLEEDFPFDKETHDRAIYTAATRAAKKLVLVR